MGSFNDPRRSIVEYLQTLYGNPGTQERHNVAKEEHRQSPLFLPSQVLHYIHTRYRNAIIIPLASTAVGISKPYLAQPLHMRRGPANNKIFYRHCAHITHFHSIICLLNWRGLRTACVICKWTGSRHGRLVNRGSFVRPMTTGGYLTIALVQYAIIN